MRLTNILASTIFAQQLLPLSLSYLSLCLSLSPSFIRDSAERNRSIITNRFRISDSDF